MLLRSFSVARISDEKSFREELEKVVSTYPRTDEGKKAAELVTWLNQEMPELKFEEEKEIATELYVADTIPLHSFAIVIKDASFNVNQATFDVISYNIELCNQNYRTESVD
jgi:hypothetical protein